MDKIKEIPQYMFAYSFSLTSITIQVSVTRIYHDAALMCKSIKRVYYLGTEVEWSKISVWDYTLNSVYVEKIFGSASLDFKETVITGEFQCICINTSVHFRTPAYSFEIKA